MSWLNDYKDVDYSRWLENGWQTGQYLREEAPVEIDNLPSESIEEDTDGDTFVPFEPKPLNYEKVYSFNDNNISNEQGGFSGGSNRTSLTGKPVKTTVTGDSIYQGLIQRGLTPAIASGFVGNFMAESSLDTSVVNGIGAVGLGQWLGGRKKALNSFAKETGKKVSDLNLQLDFVIKELQGAESHVAQKLKNVNDPTLAAKIIMQHYERPSKSEQAQSINKRIKHANAYFKPAENGVKIDSTKWLNNYTL